MDVGAAKGGGPVGGQARARRRLGPWGRGARVLVGGSLLWEVFPAILLAWQWRRSRRHPEQLRATGPVASVVNLVVVAALYSTPWYLPALSVTSDAAMIFYGASMLLAAARGYAGCEVLAVSNWVLRRDDQIGCLVFAPVDALERRRNRRHGKESIRS
jgi:hypothetical protein